MAVSRAFGDTQFKTLSSPDIRAQMPMHKLEESLVTPLPEVKSEFITPKTEFAILATDGVWDVMSPQSAVSFVRTKLFELKDLQKVSKELTQEAIRNGSVDNVTAIVMTFNSTLVTANSLSKKN